jgi:AraC family transcriptional regulator, arabinose operon regulatory protein
MARTTDPPLPASVFRREVYYRSTSGGRPRPAVDCGFLLKPGGEAYRNRVHAGYVAVFVLRGRGVFIDHRRREHAVWAGDLVQHPPGKVHSLVPDADGQWAEFFFILPAQLHRALVRIGSVSDAAVLRPGLDAVWVSRFEALMDEVRAVPMRGTAMSIAIAHELLVALHRADADHREPAEADPVSRACGWLAECEVDVDVRDVARRLGMSYERFRKLFRQRMGHPPNEYRIRRRIDRARTLIAEERLSNREVARRLRYPDAFAFSKQFKRYVGLSPQAFRATL